MFWNNMNWKKIGLFAGGVLMGSYGIRILTSRDAKKLYTHATAAAFRMKDEVMKDVATIRENVYDIAAAAADINEERARADEAREIENAKEILAQAEEKAAEAMA